MLEVQKLTVMLQKAALFFSGPLHISVFAININKQFL